MSLIKKIWNHKVYEIHKDREIIRHGCTELHTAEVHRDVTVGEVIINTIRVIGIVICFIMIMVLGWSLREFLYLAAGQ